MPDKSCPKCNHTFIVTKSDVELYKKLLIPSPTHCPDCRHQRRLCWRNDRTFYSRKCDQTGQEFVSMYSADSNLTVYHPDAFYKEDWDPLDYGRDLDFSRPFFDQFFELQQTVPRLGIDIVHCENSYFCNYCGDDKNCYLDIAGEGNEDCYFNLFTKLSKNCVDCTFAYNSELCYETIQAYNGYNLNYCINCDDCSDCSFCYDLKGCQDCLFSTNLRQKKYYIFNKPYSKEEYKRKKTELDFSSYEKTKKALTQWQEFRLKNAIHQDASLINCENSTGNNLKNCKNTHLSFNATNCEDCKYLYDVLDAKDCQDLNYSLYKPEVAFELISTLQMRYSAFCMASHYCNHCYYCDLTNNSSDCFGCIGLKRNKYCILNKQYSKEEYFELRDRLIEHMKKTKEWGQFFPAEKSLWKYEETVANEYFPVSTDQKSSSDTPQSDASSCETCSKNFLLIEQELKFYQQKGLPNPQNCPDCRHESRIQLRPKRQLFKRPCSNCNSPIQSTFKKDFAGQVFCEKCYLEKAY